MVIVVSVGVQDARLALGSVGRLFGQINKASRFSRKANYLSGNHAALGVASEVSWVRLIHISRHCILTYLLLPLVILLILIQRGPTGEWHSLSINLILIINVDVLVMLIITVLLVLEKILYNLLGKLVYIDTSLKISWVNGLAECIR